MKFYIWLDDIRPIPMEIAQQTYGRWADPKSVNAAIYWIERLEKEGTTQFVLDLDHDLGDYTKDGGDGYKLVLWLIETGRNTSQFKIKCHSANPVGREHILGLYNRYWES